MKCERCGVEIKDDEVYETNGKKVCEDCSIVLHSYGNPKKNCAQ